MIAAGTRRSHCRRGARYRCVAGVVLASALLLPLESLHAEDGARLAGSCSPCHGTNGRSVGNVLPPLAGQPREALLASLRAFKSGDRSATVMTQIARGYTEEQLERIAAFFSGQQRSPAGSGNGS